MAEPIYSLLGERLYQLLCTEIKPPIWFVPNPLRLVVGEVSFVRERHVRVELRKHSRIEDDAMNAALNQDDRERLSPLVRDAIKKLTSVNFASAVDDALNGVVLGAARDPVRAKLTASAVAMADLIKKAAESDSVGESEVRQFLDKIREDLDGI